VVAATDGVIWSVATTNLGGNVIWIFGPAYRFYYYAHLDGYKPGIQPGLRVRAGDPLGMVGNTGNASSTAPHLHFSIEQFAIGNFTWKSLDPLPYLRHAVTTPPLDGDPPFCVPQLHPKAAAFGKATQSIRISE
jgi:murein DD-endopeptidase MepM/ murein hydrolase activator NlpD